MDTKHNYQFFLFPSSLNLDPRVEEKLMDDHKRVDQIMLNLVLIHWAFAALIFPILYSNFTLGFWGGAALSAASFIAYQRFRGTTISKVIFSTSLIFFTFIFIQQSLGKIETHFHLWMVLGILLAYKDIRPIFWVSGLIILQHGTINVCQQFDLTIAGQPVVVYETGSSWITTLMHAFYVVPSAIVYGWLSSINIRNFIKLENNKLALENKMKENDEVTEQIKQQNEILMEMSTPVTQLWDDILVLPLVGIIDSKRAQDIMNSMVRKIEEQQPKAFILDISGIAIMDTAVANHIIKITKATKLMGCRSIISGVSGAVAQTMVELGVAVDEIITTGNMKDALEVALDMTSAKIVAKREGEAKVLSL